MTQNNADKGRSVGLYLYEDVLEAGPKHAAESGQSFSGYVNSLIRADLTAAGKLPGSEEAKAMAEARDVLAAVGAERFLQALKEAAKAA